MYYVPPYLDFAYLCRAYVNFVAKRASRLNFMRKNEDNKFIFLFQVTIYKYLSKETLNE